MLFIRNIGNSPFWRWIGTLSLLILIGGFFYIRQLSEGLIVTGMSDQVSWGLYIANFVFFVGIAASAVLLAVPTFIFQRQDTAHVMLFAESMAVAAVFTALLFVIADLGQPTRLWHLLPLLGHINFPASLLAWDVFVLIGYLLLNLILIGMTLYTTYRGKKPNKVILLLLIILTMFWAIAIHTVTAFLFSANTGRLLWHTALLAPRFIASAFASGGALLIFGLQVIRKVCHHPVDQSVFNLIAIVVTLSLQISLFFTGVELFTDFYNETTDVISIRYLYLGLGETTGLVIWIWAAIGLNGIAVVILSINPLRRHLLSLNIACSLLLVGIWLEKGVAQVVPGFIPTPLGEVFEYSPTVTELMVTLGIWAIGLLVLTLLIRGSYCEH